MRESRISSSARAVGSRLRLALFIGISLLITTILVSTCGTPAGIDPDACGDNVQISVSAGPTPDVSWIPHCTIGQLTIDSAPEIPETREAHFVWFLNSPLNDKGARTNRISSPARYSSRPPGVTVEIEPRPLVPSIHYRVTLVSYPIRYPADGHLEINRLDFIR